MNSGNSKKSVGKRHHGSSDEGSYDDISESDTNGSASEAKDAMTDSSEADNSDADSDAEGTDSSEEESEEDGTVTDNDAQEDDGRDKMCCPIENWEALAKMNKAMGVILKRELKRSRDSTS